MALLTAEEATAFDRAARERAGVPERVLMEDAGRSAALVLARLFPEGRILAVAGGGNNGGDALVLLRSLRAWGRDVAWLQAGPRPPDPALAHGHTLPQIEPGAAEAEMARAAVLVDGILGTGTAGAPREPAAGLIRAMNASGRPIVALDVPSGVDPTTGGVPGDAVRAAVTVTFGAPKTGLVLQPARAFCGRLIVVEIGFHPLPELEGPVGKEWRPGAALLTPGWAAVRLPARPPDAHKGTAGQLLILAGREGMAGAAALAGLGAYRAGAGLVRIASAGANREVLQAALPEAIFVAREDADALADAAARADALLAGPGIGTEDAARALLDALLGGAEARPLLLDADSLTLIGQDTARLKELAAGRQVVLTPHPGEMSRLTDETVAEILADPLGSARSLAEASGCTVLLKGTPSVVASPGEPVLVNTVSSSDLAMAGMGDQLGGTVAAFLAGGQSARNAAALGLFYSGRAAELAGRGRALGPRDVAEHLDRAFADPGPARSVLDLPFVLFDQPPRR